MIKLKNMKGFTDRYDGRAQDCKDPGSGIPYSPEERLYINETGRKIWMRKLCCVFLVLALLLSWGCVSGEEQSLNQNLLFPSLNQEKPDDQVTLVNGVYTVATKSNTFILDMTGYPSFICLTQDRANSMFYAFESEKDINTIIRGFKENHVHFDIIDVESGLEILIITNEQPPDWLSFPNFSSLPYEQQEAFAKKYGFAGLVQCGELSWMVWFPSGENIQYQFVTIVNGVLIRAVLCELSNDPEADLKDTAELLNHLIIR